MRGEVWERRNGERTGGIGMIAEPSRGVGGDLGEPETDEALESVSHCCIEMGVAVCFFTSERNTSVPCI